MMIMIIESVHDMMEMKNYIKDVIDINNREAVQYGTDTSNRTEQETIKD